MLMFCQPSGDRGMRFVKQLFVLRSPCTPLSSKTSVLYFAIHYKYMIYYYIDYDHIHAMETDA